MDYVPNIFSISGSVSSPCEEAQHSATTIYTDISEVKDNRELSLSASKGLLCFLGALLPRVQPEAPDPLLQNCFWLVSLTLSSCKALFIPGIRLSIQFWWTLWGSWLSTSPACPGSPAILPSSVLTLSINMNYSQTFTLTQKLVIHAIINLSHPYLTNLVITF